VGNTARESHKTLIIDLDELKQQLRSEWVKLDHVVIAAAIRQWRRR